jgi:hypothetical protein
MGYYSGYAHKFVKREKMMDLWRVICSDWVLTFYLKMRLIDFKLENGK